MPRLPYARKVSIRLSFLGSSAVFSIAGLLRNHRFWIPPAIMVVNETDDDTLDANNFTGHREADFYIIHVLALNLIVHQSKQT